MSVYHDSQDPKDIVSRTIEKLRKKMPTKYGPDLDQVQSDIEFEIEDERRRRDGDGIDY